MTDDSEKRLDALFAAARAQKPDTSRLEYGFETRLMARIRCGEKPQPWYTYAWRLSPVFACIVLALGIWTCCTPQDSDIQTIVTSTADESQILEYLTGKGI